MKLSFSTLGCPNWDIGQIISCAVDNGYDGVELRGYDKQISPDFVRNKRMELRKRFEESGVEICCLTAYSQFHDDNHAQRSEQADNLKKMIELAHDIGAPYVRTFGGPVERVAEAFNLLESFVYNSGVKVLLETHDVITSGKEVRELFSYVNERYYGIIWDVKHTLVNGESLQESVQYMTPYIRHLHLKDWIHLPKEKKDYYVLMKAGLFPVEELVTIMSNIGYKGYFSLEWEKAWHAEIEEPEIAYFQYSWIMRRLFPQAFPNRHNRR